SQNRRGNFRIAEKPNYRPVIKLPPSRSIDLMFSMRYGIVIPWVHLQSHWLVPRNGKVPDPWLDSQIEPLLPLRSFLPDSGVTLPLTSLPGSSCRRPCSANSSHRVHFSQYVFGQAKVSIDNVFSVLSVSMSGKPFPVAAAIPRHLQ